MKWRATAGKRPGRGMHDPKYHEPMQPGHAALSSEPWRTATQAGSEAGYPNPKELQPMGLPTSGIDTEQMIVASGER